MTAHHEYESGHADPQVAKQRRAIVAGVALALCFWLAAATFAGEAGDGWLALALIVAGCAGLALSHRVRFRHADAEAVKVAENRETMRRELETDHESIRCELAALRSGDLEALRGRVQLARQRLRRMGMGRRPVEAILAEIESDEPPEESEAPLVEADGTH